jgi:hypothetical protein
MAYTQIRPWNAGLVDPSRNRSILAIFFCCEALRYKAQDPPRHNLHARTTELVTEVNRLQQKRSAVAENALEILVGPEFAFSVHQQNVVRAARYVPVPHPNLGRTEPEGLYTRHNLPPPGLLLEKVWGDSAKGMQKESPISECGCMWLIFFALAVHERYPLRVRWLQLGELWCTCPSLIHENKLSSDFITRLRVIWFP